MDRLKPEQRSENMRRIRNKNSGPEMIVRRLLHKLGYRYRLHGKDLPGRPDIVFAARRKVIFVHGCFWHRHTACDFAYNPKSRTDFWNAKFEQNVNRDNRAVEALTASGWSTLIVWECEIKDVNLMAIRLRAFLGD